MMKAVAAAVILPTVMSCTKGEGSLDVSVITQDKMEKKTITFTFGGDGVEQSPMTRSSLSDANITDLWLFDYMGIALQQTIHQQSTDDGFGAVSLTVDYGEHALYFVASRGDTPTIDGTIISWVKPSDTFWQSTTLDIQPSTATAQSVSLQRVAARLRITVADEVPDGLATLSVTPSHWYYGLDYMTGEAADDRQTARVVNVPASYVGTTGQLAASFYCISPATEWKTDITLTAATTEATLANLTIPNVPMRRNSITDFSGTLFSAGRSMNIEVDDEWGDPLTGTW